MSSELPSLLENAAQGQLRQLPTDTTQGLVGVKREATTWQKPVNYSCIRIDFIYHQVWSGRSLAQEEGRDLKPYCTKPSKMLRELKLDLSAGAGTEGWLQHLQPALALCTGHS